MAEGFVAVPRRAAPGNRDCRWSAVCRYIILQ